MNEQLVPLADFLDLNLLIKVADPEKPSKIMITCTYQ